MLKREWGAESKGKLPHLFIPCKTATWVPEFAMEDLPLVRIAALVPEFAVKDLPLGRILMMMMMIVTEDYLCYKEPKSPYNFFLILIFNELFKFKISDERQH